jgi:hypothetical protein
MVLIWGVEALAGSVDYVRDVKPILTRHCVACHGAKVAKAGLRLDTSAAIHRGSKAGPAIVPGQSDESALIEAVLGDGATERMPLKQPPLSEAQIATLRGWIDQGAIGPKTETPGEAVVEHWSFRAPSQPRVPVATHAGLRNDIDRFIAAALEAKKLTLAPEAEPAVLLRRVAFDLIGLPPTLEEADAFLADRVPGAYERMVERYLASPHYGERWGKYWLDAAGYADSNGYYSTDSDRPLAYKYRDYVIRAFNFDKPFDRFVQEQLAGDELAGYGRNRDTTPAMAELLTATHFLRNGPDGTGDGLEDNLDVLRTDRYSVLENNLQITMNTLLGITIQCARCHDHKFEPISQEEYYRLQAILVPVYCPDRWVKPNDRVVAIAPRYVIEENQRQIEQHQRQSKAIHDGLELITRSFRERLVGERLAALDAPLRERVLQAVATPGDKLTAPQKLLLKEHVEPLNITEDVVAKRFPEYAAVRKQLNQVIAAQEMQRPPALERVAVSVDVDSRPPAHHVLLRGQHNRPGPEVTPGVPAALSSAKNRYTLPAAPGIESSGRRLAFARWLTNPENPLLARVFVNRVWQYHFGNGFVADPDNFGVSGSPPSHPELLDWLAVGLVESGYSVKALHRLILNSSVYRQTSTPTGPAATVALTLDPENRLLSRFPLRRLDAEALRDAMLSISGGLDLRAGGPYVPAQSTSVGDVAVDEQHPGAHRRSVYLQQKRSQVVTFLELFDAPPITMTCAARSTSTVPLQSLALLNGDDVRSRAAAFAQRLRRQAGTDVKARLKLAFRLALGRAPVDDEQAAAMEFLERQQGLYAPADNGDALTWTDFCQMLLASNAFLYLN